VRQERVPTVEFFLSLVFNLIASLESIDTCSNIKAPKIVDLKGRIFYRFLVLPFVAKPSGSSAERDTRHKTYHNKP